MIGGARGLLWRLLIPVPQAEIGSSANEESDSFFRTSLSCMMQWGKTRQICRIDISPRIKQGCNHSRVVSYCRPVKRPSTIQIRACIESVDVGPRPDRNDGLSDITFNNRIPKGTLSW